jgi:hypothetical protein
VNVHTFRICLSKAEFLPAGCIDLHGCPGTLRKKKSFFPGPECAKVIDEERKPDEPGETVCGSAGRD